MGDIWLATAKGISRLPTDWKISGASSKQPLPIQVEFPSGNSERTLPQWPRSLRSRDGLIWFATDHGVVNFRPVEIKSIAPVPAVRIEIVRANGQLQSGAATKPLRLPANLRDMEIQFTALSLASPGSIHFRHKLEGFDPDWQDSTATRRARYGKLPPGKYQFRVQASDAAGRWSEKETALTFIVPTPLWRTSWAIVLECLLLITLAATIARMVSHRRLRRKLARLEQQQAMERERTRIARDMHDKLGAKLTKISFVSERARNDLAQHAVSSAKLDSIAVTSRELLHSLDEIVWAVNPKNDTLEHLAAYLGQYAAEYFQNTNVECDLEMPDALPEQHLSAEVRHNVFLAVEESLSNALKHSGATRVRIVMAHSEAEFQIRISDNGRGLENAESKNINSKETGKRARRRGTGLRSMNERLASIGGRCEVFGPPGEGTTVTLRIALANKERRNA
jgi:signal transduction histidine kinase